MSKIKQFILTRIHLFILGGAFIASSFALLIIMQFDASRLISFGPKAQIYFASIKNGLIFSSAILFISFIIPIIFGRYLDSAIRSLRNFYSSLSEVRKNILILAICFVFTFASHAGNITNGYFNMDDFEIIRINNTAPLGEALITPHGNDHIFPLFMAEMRLFGALFGQNEVPYNAALFIMFSLIPFFTYLTFKRLRFPLSAFAVFLVVFSGATSWAIMLTGFYIMWVYPQIIFFFSVASWAYVAWLQSKEKKYLAFFAAALISALLSDTSGMWVIPAIILFMSAVYFAELNNNDKKLT